MLFQNKIMQKNENGKEINTEPKKAMNGNDEIEKVQLVTSKEMNTYK